MRWKIGSLNQILISTAFIALGSLAIFIPQVENIHLTVTILITVLQIYVGVQWSEGKLKPKGPGVKSYFIAYVVNAIISVACNWWFCGFLWIYVSLIYTGVHLDNQEKIKMKGN